MPRDASGTYSPPLADVTPGDTITSSWANTTIDDIAQALTESLSREGDGGMNAPFLNASGVVGAPGITWTETPTMGWYRPSANETRFVVGGTDRYRTNASNPLQLWNDTDARWESVLTVGDGTLSAVPGGSQEGSGLRWDDTAGAWDEVTDITMDGAGNVGINKTIPTSELHVKALSDNTANIAVESVSGANALELVLSDTLAGASVQSTTNVTLAAALEANINTNSSNRINIDSAGEITLPDFAGGGTRTLQVDNNGVLSAV